MWNEDDKSFQFGNTVYSVNPTNGQPWDSEEQAIAVITTMTTTPMPETPELTQVEILNQSVKSGDPLVELALKEGAYWLTTDTVIVITGDIELPNSELMVMIEKQTDGVSTDDIRRPAVIEDGKLTLKVKFTKSGNYRLDPDRLSRGLQRVGKNIQLKFTPIEVEVYDPI